MKTLVLCGGQGTRLRSVVSGVPKPMAAVAGKPWLEWLVLALRDQGIRDITLCTGYRGEVIEDYFKDGSTFGVRITYSSDDQPLGTAGAIRAATASNGYRGPVLVLNGDSYTPFDVQRLVADLESHHAQLSLWLVPVDDGARFGCVQLAADGWVESFREKGSGDSPALVSAGIYLMDSQLINDLPDDRPLSLEENVLPRLVPRQIHAVVGGGPLVDIGTPDSYRRAADVLTPVFERLSPRTLPEDALGIEVARRMAETANTISMTGTQCRDQIIAAARIIQAAFRAGSKLLLCGNGGSAADSQHIAAEFVNLLRKDRSRDALPAIALTTDTSVLTAIANDFGYETVFARQVQALGRPGDVLFVISTSGKSINVIKALEEARRRGLVTIGLFGSGGGTAASVDCLIEVPHHDTQLVQESMLPVEHVLCDLVERFVAEEPAWR